MGPNVGLWGALLVSGFLGSMGHCIGMCGPLVMIVGLQFTDRHWRAALPRHVLYQGARVAVYSLLGAAIGAVGSFLGLGPRLNTVGGIISLILGLAVIAFGLGYLGWRPLGQLEGWGTWLNRAMGRALKQGGLRGVILLGALNGLLPCCLVYSALLAAAAGGGVIQGALAMAAFGLGTIPALVIIGLGAGALSARIREALTRIAGIVIVIVGLQLALRGAAALRLVPHLELGRIVIW